MFKRFFCKGVFVKSYRYQVEFNKYDIEEDILNHIIEINFAKTDCKTSFYSFAKSKLGGDIIIIANHGENDLSFEAFTVGAITTKKDGTKDYQFENIGGLYAYVDDCKISGNSQKCIYINFLGAVYQNDHIGSDLLEACVNYSYSAGYPYIVLNSLANAKGFYERFGFKPYKQSIFSTKINGYYYDTSWLFYDHKRNNDKVEQSK